MRRLLAAALIACEVHGGPVQEGWEGFEAGAPAGDDAGDDADTLFGPDGGFPPPVKTDAGCPAAKPADGTPCTMWTGPGVQLCPYVVHGGTRTCACERLTPESDDLWRCR